MASLGPLRTDDGRDGEPEVGEGDEAEGEADEEGVSSIVEADTQARAAVAPPPSPPCAAGKLLHQRHKKLRADLSACKYEAVREAMEQLGWEILAPADEGEVADDSWNIYWTDVSVSQERVTRLRPLQRINHFPGMLELARKAGTARNLNRMLERYPNEYKIFPPTWLLPADLTDFKAQFTAKRNKTFIVKPSRGCQGKDIMLTRSLEGISLHENYIAQRYMHRPYLLDGYKFDLRIYVLLTSVEPLRVYLHTEGMVRICTSKYGPVTGSNLEDQCMHLTNYAINKHADGYVPAASSNDNGSHKRLLSSLLAHLSARGEDVPRLVQLMREAVVKCLIAVQPHLAHNYYACQQRRVRRARARAARALDTGCSARPCTARAAAGAPRLVIAQPIRPAADRQAMRIPASLRAHPDSPRRRTRVRHALNSSASISFSIIGSSPTFSR